MVQAEIAAFLGLRPGGRSVGEASSRLERLVVDRRQHFEGCQTGSVTCIQVGTEPGLIQDRESGLEWLGGRG